MRPESAGFDVGHDEMRTVRPHSLDADFEIGPADVDPHRFDAGLVQPLRCPGVPAAAVEEHVAGFELQQGNRRPEQLDEIERMFGAVRVEG
jgi:hypothetical protein